MKKLLKKPSCLRGLVAKTFVAMGIFLPATIFSQTFTGGSGPINDVATTDFPLVVSGLSPATIDTTTFGLETVCINLTHTYDSDLQIQIIAPDGTTEMLSDENGAGNDNYLNTCFNTTATIPITQGSAPFTGTFIPQGAIGRVNNGQIGNGIWILRVIDLVAQDAGNMISWSLTFGNNPASYYSFSSSNLPIVVINTNNQNISDNPKIMADMGIIYNGAGIRNYLTDPYNDYNGKIGIEYRGSSSQWNFQKKPYGFETWDSNGNALDTSLLGMPSENDWVLIPGYSDKTLMRNEFTYWMWGQMGYYTPRGQPVEVMLNNVYIGVYFLGEKVKRDNNRVAIAKLNPTDTSGDQLTGGYILKVDKATGSSPIEWYSVYPPANNATGNPVAIIVHYPDDSSIVPQQLAYIHAYSDSFEIALHSANFTDTAIGYRHFADEKTFVDYFLLTEYTKNLDGYRSSCYFYKDMNSVDRRFKMGPVWDYDLSYGNANFCNTWLTSGWAYQFNSVCPGDAWEVPFWWDRLMQDSSFAQDVRCRWEELKIVLFNPAVVNAYIDSMALYLNESQARNYQAWPIMGSYVWPNYYIAPDYQGEVDTLKWWIQQRYNWMDANLPGNPALCNITAVNTIENNPAALTLYPNPFSNEVHLNLLLSAPAEVHITLFDMLGREVQPEQIQQHNGGSQTLTFTTNPQLSPGIYLVRVTAGNSSWTQQLSKVNDQ